MTRTAMLRFSDAETATVSAHQEIIAAQGQTWWGWWKKQTEAFRGPFLTYLRDASGREPLRIGLVNRKGEERLYVATCQGVAFSADGMAIPSPDPRLTPDYYRAQSFPAWFRLIKIEEIAKTHFLREFGDV